MTTYVVKLGGREYDAQPSIDADHFTAYRPCKRQPVSSAADIACPIKAF